MAHLTVGIIGLGRMGAQIARRLYKAGFNVIAWNRNLEPRQKFIEFGGQVRETVEEVLNDLPNPKIVWLMLPSGELVDEFINSISKNLSKGDIVIDGGNSFYEDTLRRAQELKSAGIHFFDCGTSGGIWGERNGFSLMIGGPKEIFPQVEPIFQALAASSTPSPGEGRVPEGREGLHYGLVGDHGAGHFVKMVHNGIEYGMMEAIAEGLAILKASPFHLDLAQVAQIWSRGSVVSSWLVKLAKNALETEDLDKAVGYIHSTGEGEWAIQTAKKLGIDARVIEDAFKVRQESTNPETWEKFSNKIVALLRKQFGGHAVKYKDK